MIISIEPLGNLANRMIALMAAMSLASKCDGNITYNVDLPEWGMKFDSHVHESLKNDPINTLIFTDVDAVGPFTLVEKLVQTGKRDCIFHGFFQREVLLQKPDFYQRKFEIRDIDTIDFADDEIVLNIRAGEILNGVGWYPLVPPKFYELLVKKTGLRPVLLGQLDYNLYLDEVIDRLSGPRLIPTAGPITDFNRLRQAKRICCSVSTFSWLASWLSDASEIHYPLLGFLHPHRFKPGTQGLGGIDLVPASDHRYRFHLFPYLNGEPVQEYLKSISKHSLISREVSSSFASFLKFQKQILPVPEYCATVDEKWYLKEYPCAAWDISAGWYRDASHHYEDIGRQKGYAARRPSGLFNPLN